MAQMTQLITADELLRMPRDGFRYKLIHCGQSTPTHGHSLSGIDRCGGFDCTRCA